MSILSFQKKERFYASLFLLLFLSFNSQADIWYDLGYEYSQQGKHQKAFNMMQKSASIGNPAAQNNLGLSYLYGLGVDKNKYKAFVWFKKAAKQGLADAQNELGLFYYDMKKVKKAYDWWIKSAKQNNEYAEFNLGSFFLEQNNKTKAKFWFEKSLKHKHPKAKQALDYVIRN